MDDFKVLVANRGEIGVRIFKACRELDLRSVAVYSEADKNCLHVKKADEAYCIGPANSKDSYLQAHRIMRVALGVKVNAIHPGYGFLSENAQFAEICEEQYGIIFIGPTAETMRKVASKEKAKVLVKKAGVSVIPGSDEGVKTIKEALGIAKEIGYPIMIKAVAGGGGRGMRIVVDDNELKQAFESAQSEARQSFGNSGMYLERYFPRSRHIEFQILADKYGNVVYLGERDCSVQRRHQKLIEEAPADLSLELRKKMGQDAIKVAEAVNYTNAGTVEFLLDEEGNHYFLELNTRIQVEHPVTEMITGIDIVKKQIEIARGEKLDLSQEDISLFGHAIEFRINAEDPENNFLPNCGLITDCDFPLQSEHIRLDTHIYKGYEVPPYYDSLLAKLIVWDETRHKAMKQAKRALGYFNVEGIKTTAPYYKNFLRNEHYKKRQIFTDFFAPKKVGTI